MRIQRVNLKWRHVSREKREHRGEKGRQMTIKIDSKRGSDRWRSPTKSDEYCRNAQTLNCLRRCLGDKGKKITRRLRNYRWPFPGILQLESFCANEIRMVHKHVISAVFSTTVNFHYGERKKKGKKGDQCSQRLHWYEGSIRVVVDRLS